MNIRYKIKKYEFKLNSKDSSDLKYNIYKNKLDFYKNKLMTGGGCCPTCGKYQQINDPQLLNDSSRSCCRTCKNTNGQQHGPSIHYTCNLNQPWNAQSNSPWNNSQQSWSAQQPWNMQQSKAINSNQQSQSFATATSSTSVSYPTTQNIFPPPIIGPTHAVFSDIVKNSNLQAYAKLLSTPLIICFYDSKAPYNEFTNFYPNAPFTCNSITYKTAEHYFQAHKFAKRSPTLFAKIINAPSAKVAFDIANETANKQFIDGNWHKIISTEPYKEEVMYDALKLKFANPTLRDLLLSTKGYLLIEDSPYDEYWGVGKNGDGKNRLGLLLMRLRDQILSS